MTTRSIRQLKQEIYRVIEVGSHSWLAKLFDQFMIALICLNVVAFTFETVDEISIPYKSYFNDFETLSCTIFTIEYGLRIWTCTLERNFRHPITGRLKFALTPLAIIDLISIFPYYLFILFPDLVFTRELHLLRLTRLLKIGRYSEAMRILGRVIKAKQKSLFSALFAVFSLLMVSSSLIYYMEHAAPARSVPQYSGLNVVGCNYPDHCGLWGCLSRHADRQTPGRLHCDARSRSGGAASGHHCLWLYRRN